MFSSKICSVCNKYVFLVPFKRFAHITSARFDKPLDTIQMAYASYESTGETTDAPPLVIMHGLFGSKGNWNSLCKAYHKKTEPTRKIIAVDARNHGDSPHSMNHSYPHMAEDILAFLQHHKISKAALLGHSMGGRAVMYFALKYPDMVEKLIVADMSPVRTSTTLATMPSLFDVLRQIDFPKEGTMSTGKQSVDKQLAKRIPDKGLRAFLLTNVVQKSEGGFAWRINLGALVNNYNSHLVNFPHIPDSTYDGPTLFIAGGASDFVTKADEKSIQKIFPKAQFHYVDGAGHWLHSEKPDEFLRETLQFLNTNT